MYQMYHCHTFLPLSVTMWTLHPLCLHNGHFTYCSNLLWISLSDAELNIVFPCLCHLFVLHVRVCLIPCELAEWELDEYIAQEIKESASIQAELIESFRYWNSCWHIDKKKLFTATTSRSPNQVHTFLPSQILWLKVITSCHCVRAEQLISLIRECEMKCGKSVCNGDWRNALALDKHSTSM